MSFLFVQNQPTTITGAGAIAGATSVILTSLTQIDGTVLTMADFGAIGYGTIEPGNSTLEEQISFTGITQNANGTATLTGVKTVLTVSPYTETSGLAQTHAGNTTFVISNTAGFYNQLLAKADDATITGKYTFPNGANTPVLGGSYVAPTLDTQVASKKYVDDVSIVGAADATTSTQGLVQLPTQAEVDAGTATGSTGASLTPTPALLRSKLLNDYVADTGAANAYVITPGIAIVAYVTGQRFTFKVKTTNTGASTLAVSGLSATQIIRNDGASTALGSGDLVAGQIVEVEETANGFALLTPVANATPSGSIQMYAGATAPAGWLLCDATSYLRTDYPTLFGIISTTYGNVDGTHFNVPDFRGRSPIGAGTGTGGGASGTGLPAGGSALTAVSRGTWNGAETHTLTSAESGLPAHTHTLVMGNSGGNGPAPANPSSAASGSTAVASTFAAAANSPADAANAHTIVQPILGVQFIIKT